MFFKPILIQVLNLYLRTLTQSFIIQDFLFTVCKIVMDSHLWQIGVFKSQQFIKWKFVCFETYSNSFPLNIVLINELKSKLSENFKLTANNDYDLSIIVQDLNSPGVRLLLKLRQNILVNVCHMKKGKGFLLRFSNTSKINVKYYSNRTSSTDRITNVNLNI